MFSLFGYFLLMKAVLNCGATENAMLEKAVQNCGGGKLGIIRVWTDKCYFNLSLFKYSLSDSRGSG